MAGFFGLFDYSKPGKGVRKDEPVKPRFLLFWELFFRKFWKLIQLNLLYVAFCLPIVTIGPATAGFTYVLRNFANEKPVFLFSDFWDAFKGNLKQSFAYSVFLAAAAVLLSVAWRFYMDYSAENTWMYVPMALCFMMIVLIVFMTFYAFLMMVTLDLRMGALLKNAAILSLVCLKTNILTLLFTGIIVLAVYLFPVLGLLLCIFIIPALIGFIICFNSYPGIQKYAIDPFLKAQAEKQAATAEETADGIFRDEQPRQG